MDIDRITPIEDAVREVIEIDLLRPHWMRNAACRGQGSAVFFPAEELSAEADAARQVCAGCRVRTECLDYALAAGIRHGVWGGLLSQERSVMAGPTRRATGNWRRRRAKRLAR